MKYFHLIVGGHHLVKHVCTHSMEDDQTETRVFIINEYNEFIYTFIY